MLAYLEILLLDPTILLHIGVLVAPVSWCLIKIVAATLHAVYILLVMQAALVAQALRALSVMIP